MRRLAKSGAYCDFYGRISELIRPLPLDTPPSEVRAAVNGQFKAGRGGSAMTIWYKMRKTVLARRWIKMRQIGIDLPKQREE